LYKAFEGDSTDVVFLALETIFRAEDGVPIAFHKSIAHKGHGIIETRLRKIARSDLLLRFERSGYGQPSMNAIGEKERQRIDIEVAGRPVGVVPSIAHRILTFIQCLDARYGEQSAIACSRRALFGNSRF